MTAVLKCHEIETMENFRAGLVDPVVICVRNPFDGVKRTGPKNPDYFGHSERDLDTVAIDSGILTMTKAAEIANGSYDHISRVIRAAAEDGGLGLGHRVADCGRS